MKSLAHCTVVAPASLLAADFLAREVTQSRKHVSDLKIERPLTKRYAARV